MGCRKAKKPFRLKMSERFSVCLKFEVLYTISILNDVIKK